MKQRRNIAFLAGAGVLLAGYLAIHYLPSHEPTYQGRGLSYWVNALRTADATAARNAIHEIGTNAIGPLCRSLVTHDSALKQKWRNLLAKQRLIEIQLQYEGDRHNLEAEAFQYLGPQAELAIPVLTNLFARPGCELVTLRALSYCGPAAVPFLLQALSHPSPAVRAQTALCITTEQAGNMALPTLAKNLRDPNSSVRELTALAVRYFVELLKRSGKSVHPELFIPPLLANLQETNHFVRHNASRALAVFGRGGTNAVPALVGLLSDPNEDIRREARFSLRHIDPAAAAELEIK